MAATSLVQISQVTVLRSSPLSSATSIQIFYVVFNFGELLVG